MPKRASKNETVRGACGVAARRCPEPEPELATSFARSGAGSIVPRSLLIAAIVLTLMGI